MKFPIRWKIFVGFLIVLILVFSANLYFNRQVAKLEDFIDEASKGAKAIDTYQKLLQNTKRAKNTLIGYENSVYSTPEVSLEKAFQQVQATVESLKEQPKVITEALATAERVGSLLKEKDYHNASKARDLYYDELSDQINKAIAVADKNSKVKVQLGLLGKILKNEVNTNFYKYKLLSTFQELTSAMNALASQGVTDSVVHNIDTIIFQIKSKYLAGQEIKNSSSITNELLLTKLEEQVGAQLGSESRAIQEVTEKSREVGRSAEDIGFWGSTLTFILSLFIAFIIAQQIGAPIQRLKEATRRARKGDYSATIPVKSKDEVGELTSDFNTMLQEIKELEQMKSNFFASITHDLKSPLGRIKAALFNLKEDEENFTSIQRELLDLMGRSATTLTRLIHNLLDLQKIEKGAFAMDLRRKDICPCINDWIEVYKHQLGDKNIELKRDIEFDHLELFFDAKHLRRVFDNLIINAMKYTPKKGTISLEGKLLEDKVMFSIKDTGEGIDEKELPYIFNKFYQVKGKDKPRGTGLGLTITKEIVEGHNGEIWVESDPGFGSAFYFTLPINKNLGTREQEQDDET